MTAHPSLSRYAYTAAGINYNLAFKGDRVRRKGHTEHVVAAAEHDEHYERPQVDPANRKKSVPVHKLNPMLGEMDRQSWANRGFFAPLQ